MVSALSLFSASAVVAVATAATADAIAAAPAPVPAPAAAKPLKKHLICSVVKEKKKKDF